ncbi:hypothetical protein F5148DRAFT_403669 [Russula earlei]|uniref:Uncharacterized protein n=1 Tax=Russula earlei TaxID=71964 RepID=A0ACC0UIT3_9AGAM|nr:hypothetical protein F5148DRAFT_403669 [Russula earlei]
MSQVYIRRHPFTGLAGVSSGAREPLPSSCPRVDYVRITCSRSRLLGFPVAPRISRRCLNPLHRAIPRLYMCHTSSFCNYLATIAFFSAFASFLLHRVGIMFCALSHFIPLCHASQTVLTCEMLHFPSISRPLPSPPVLALSIKPRPLYHGNRLGWNQLFFKKLIVHMSLRSVLRRTKCCLWGHRNLRAA